MITNWIGKRTGYVHTTFYMLCVLLAIVWLPSYSIIELSVWFVPFYLLAAYLISGFQHRYCSHKSWQPSLRVESISAFLCAAFLLTPSMGWASTHRTHHKHTDTDKDPHGNAHSILRNFLVFNYPPKMTLIPRWMLRHPVYQLQAKYYWETGIVVGALMFLVGLGTAWVSFIAFCYIFQVTLNIIGHLNRNPVNNTIGAIMWGGELYHKNHHDKPSLSQFGLFDATYHFFIKHLDTRGK
jgi:fatty-acid desaturase